MMARKPVMIAKVAISPARSAAAVVGAHAENSWAASTGTAAARRASSTSGVKARFS